MVGRDTEIPAGKNTRRGNSLDQEKQEDGYGSESNTSNTVFKK